MVGVMPNHPDVVAQRRHHHRLDPIAGDVGVVVEAGPAHVGQQVGAGVRRDPVSDGGVDAAHAQHGIAQPGPGQPVGPGAQQVVRVGIAHRFPRRTEHQFRPHRGLAPGMQRLVGLKHFRRDAVALEDAGGADGIVDGHAALQARDPLFGREAGRHFHQGELDQGIEVVVQEHARRLAGGILLDGHRVVGGRGVAADAGQGQGARVGGRNQGESMAPGAPDGSNVDRVVGRRPVQVVPVGIAFLGQAFGDAHEVRRVAHGHGDDPLAWVRLGGQGGDAVDDLVDGFRPGQGRRDLLQPLPVHVGVAVDETGDHRPSPGIDGAGLGAAQFFQVTVVADGQEAPILHRQGRGDAERPVDGDHLAIAEDQIGLHAAASRFAAPGPSSFAGSKMGISGSRPRMCSAISLSAKGPMVKPPRTRPTTNASSWPGRSPTMGM